MRNWIFRWKNAFCLIKSHFKTFHQFVIFWNHNYFHLENRLQSLLTYRKNKPTSRLQPSNETEKKDTRRLSRDSVSSDRKSDRNHKKKRRSHSTDSANQMSRSGVRQSRRDTERKCHDTSQNSTHPVVISRKSREKVKKDKQYFDEKIITSDDSALSPDLSRESSTTSSSFDSDSRDMVLNKLY